MKKLKEKLKNKLLLAMDFGIRTIFKEEWQKLESTQIYRMQKNLDELNEFKANAERDPYEAIDYFDFENRFRGPRENVKSVQEQYIKYYEGRKNVLDLGCGRGEFLELLKEHQIPSVGVDLYDKAVAFCQSIELPAERRDAIEFLRSQEDGSVGGIFASQLIEHLPFNLIMELCQLAYQKLEKDAYMILETPNPMSLAVFTHAFYIDPSHNKPVHPLTLQYILQKAGFTNVEIFFTPQSRLPMEIPSVQSTAIENLEELNKSLDFVNDTLFGSQDYAVIVKK